MASKIIVTGAIHGQLESAFAKVAKLHAKSNFDFAIVVGDLFSEDNDTALSDLLSGKIVIPLPTYFTVGTLALPARVIEKIKKEEEICPNLYFLGKHSTTTTSDGIRIVALGGQLDENATGLSEDQISPFHTIGDVKALHGAKTADILISAFWPASVLTGSKALPPKTTAPKGSRYIADLCSVLKPRYHLSTFSDLFFEREPFFHPPVSDVPDTRPVTRFISLASYGTPNQRALYAFSLPLKVDHTAPFPVGCTPSPFIPYVARTNLRKRPLEDDAYAAAGNDRNGDHKYRKGRGGGRQFVDRRPDPSQCYFCLGNPNVGEHLVCTIGDHSYMTIAKGPLTDASTNAELGLNFPSHSLIIPLNHCPTLASIAEGDDIRKDTYTEMTKFREAMQKMVAKRSENKLGAVIYEISKARGVHTHWQFVPVPAELIQKGLVQAAFQVEASNLCYPVFKERDPELGLDERNFFRAWIFSPPTEEFPEGGTKCITMSFDDSHRFDLQFGRRVLAKLLGLEKRMQWQDCSQTQEEEVKDCTALKEAFKEFDDFTG